MSVSLEASVSYSSMMARNFAYLIGVSSSDGSKEDASMPSCWCSSLNFSNKAWSAMSGFNVDCMHRMLYSRKDEP